MSKLKKLKKKKTKNKIKKINKKNKNLMQQSGQAVIEAVLIMTLVFGLAVFFNTRFRNSGIIGSLTAGPWGAIAGMMSNGVWKSEREGRELHPHGNVMSRQGDNQ